MSSIINGLMAVLITANLLLAVAAFIIGGCILIELIAGYVAHKK